MKFPESHYYKSSMSLSTEVYWMLRERRGCCFVYNLADEIKSIDSLERLLELSPDKIKHISKISNQGKELSREIKKIQRECKTKGGVWLTDTEPPHKSDRGLVYKHWLPVDQSRLLGRRRMRLKTLGKKYWKKNTKNLILFVMSHTSTQLRPSSKRIICKAM